MAGRDENGCQATRRNTAGISKEGEYQTRFLHFYEIIVRIMEQILSCPSCFLEIFDTVVADAGGTSSRAARRGLEAG